MSMQQWNKVDDDFFNRLIFGDESPFHLSGKVNKQNVRILGTETPRELVQYARDSLKLNVFCALSRTKVYGSSVDKDMLRSVWTELDYRIDICCVTKGSHIEHL
jgi:hypothetical protein